MKNRTKEKLRRLLSMVLAGAMMLSSINMPHVNAEQANVREKTWQTENCIITYTLTDQWDTGYTAVVNVQNVSESDIENWHVSFSEYPQIIDLWNARYLRGKSDEIIFKNVGWNQDITAGSGVNFGFTVNEAFQGFPEIAELAVSRQTVSREDYNIVYQVRDDWETGYVGSVTIQNISERAIEDWMLSFDLPYEINDIWNGQILSCENGNYLIKNKTDHQNIAAGESLEIGFTVNSGSAAEQPESFLLEEYALAVGTGTPDAQTENEQQDVSGNSVTENDIPGIDVSDGDPQTEILLTINTDGFDLNEKLQMYLTQNEVSSLGGGLQGAERIEKLSYSITDLYDLEVKSGDIDIQEQWEIRNIGLVLGLNRIKVTAVSREEAVYEEEIFLMNFNMENMKNADVDMRDTDQDGIEDYFEGVFGTDPVLADTDGDGLTDREELFFTGTDPLSVDTDDNGVSDGEEDIDKDGLNNLEEMAEGTGAYYPDSDGDGLTDGEEVRQYHTDPLVPDTDEDGLTDGQDVKLGFDPLNPDTDGNGVQDGSEVVYQTYTKDLDQERKAGVTSVSVSMDCAGYIEDQVWIQNAYNLDMRSTNVVGLFGAPVIIETENVFDEAVITIAYDESTLGEIEEDNLRIMWYDEENDVYRLLDEETVADKENHTLSCTTTHFSTWMVVDRMAWLNSIGKDLGYGEIGNGNSQTVYYDIVTVFNAMDAEGISDIQWRALGKPSIYGYWAALEGKKLIIVLYGRSNIIGILMIQVL